MRKDADVKTIGGIVLAVVVLVLVLFWFYGPGGSFNRATNTASTIVNATNLSIGGGEDLGSKPTIPAEQEKAILSLKETIDTIISSKKTDCFQNYLSLPSLKKSGIVLSFEYDSQNKETLLLVQGGIENKQQLAFYEFKNIQPCVIAGEEVTTNFNRQFLLKDGSILQPFAQPLSFLQIYTHGDNKITFSLGSEKVEADLHDGGWLFAPQNYASSTAPQLICFFPTSDGGLDEEVVSGSEASSLSQQSSAGVLPLCSTNAGATE